VHPITSGYVSVELPFCAIRPTKFGDITKITDICNTDINDTFKTTQSELSTLYPLINFDAEQFLESYYKITDETSFNEFLKNSKMYPVMTKLRIIDCFIMTYGKNVTLVDDAFPETILSIIKAFWIKRMYGKLSKFVYCDESDHCSFVNPKINSLRKDEYIKQRTKFMFFEILTIPNITRVSNNYFNDLANNGKEFTITDSGIENYYEYLLGNIPIIAQKNKN